MRGQELERVPDLFLFVRFPVALRGSTRGSGLRNSRPDLNKGGMAILSLLYCWQGVRLQPYCQPVEVPCWG
ncbi:Uncharacterised protein [Mycobacteroides abscessus subsp. abscessus]|nr:Uncharacterised protein [Mycobacteroides abscessus subsp. abscessus]